MMQEEILLNGKKFSYRTNGEGPVVMLIHGFGEDGSVWDRQYNIFKDFQLIIPQLPGTGGSEMTDDMSMDGMAATIKGFMDHLDIKQCCMIGHSMGGYITLAFAEAYDKRLNSFGLFHSTAFADTEEKKQTRKKGIDFINKNGAYEFLKIATPNLYSPSTKENNPGLIEEHIASTKNFLPEALIRYYQAMIDRTDRTNVLKESKVPVLFVLGRHDQAIPFQDVLKQSYLPTISQAEFLENSGHMGMREETDRSNSILFAFTSFLSLLK
ncbi:MAG: alpha/beta fold hydrolase [Flavisolibacter sp.]